MISSNEYAVTERQTQLHISMKHIRLESCSAPYKLKAHTTLQQVVVVAQHSRGEVCCACLSTTELIGVFCSAHQIDHDLHLLRHDIHCHAAVASARFQNSVTSNSGLIAQSCQSCRIGQRYRTIVWTPFCLIATTFSTYAFHCLTFLLPRRKETEEVWPGRVAQIRTAKRNSCAYDHLEESN